MCPYVCFYLCVHVCFYVCVALFRSIACILLKFSCKLELLITHTRAHTQTNTPTTNTHAKHTHTQKHLRTHTHTHQTHTHQTHAHTETLANTHTRTSRPCSCPHCERVLSCFPPPNGSSRPVCGHVRLPLRPPPTPGVLPCAYSVFQASVQRTHTHTHTQTHTQTLTHTHTHTHSHTHTQLLPETTAALLARWSTLSTSVPTPTLAPLPGLLLLCESNDTIPHKNGSNPPGGGAVDCNNDVSRVDGNGISRVDVALKCSSGSSSSSSSTGNFTGSSTGNNTGSVGDSGRSGASGVGALHVGEAQALQV